MVYQYHIRLLLHFTGKESRDISLFLVHSIHDVIHVGFKE
jgi:hypothetical protein